MNREKQPLQLSIFDRLHEQIDSGILGGDADDIRIVRKSVLRDVENLLNTRRSINKASERFHYLKRSLYTYGVEDFVSKNPRSPHVRQTIRETIQDTISRFEPRLKNVSVDFRSEDGNSQNLCFSVHANLHADPMCEPISFDTWFSASRGEYKIDNVK